MPSREPNRIVGKARRFQRMPLDSYASHAPTPPLPPLVGREDHPAPGGKKPKGLVVYENRDARRCAQDGQGMRPTSSSLSPRYRPLLAFFGPFGLLPGASAFFIGVAALYAGLAAWLRYGKSRVAAIVLVALTSVAMVGTIVTLPTTGGANVFLAAIVFFAAAKAVEAIFKLHGRFKTDLAVIASPQSTEGQGRNYFARHWRGDLSLPVSFWANGVLLNLIVVVRWHS